MYTGNISLMKSNKQNHQELYKLILVIGGHIYRQNKGILRVGLSISKTTNTNRILNPI